jgi:uncharacterized protein YbcI
MSEDDQPRNTELSDHDLQRGYSLLNRISTEVVQTFKEYYGKGPTSAKTYMMDDLLFVVMRGGLTPPEKFLLEQGEEDVVRAYRQTFENRMTQTLSGKIEKLTERKVIGFQSQVLFEPAMSIEIFVFDDRSPEEGIDMTAAAQIEQQAAGEVPDENPAQSTTATAE